MTTANDSAAPDQNLSPKQRRRLILRATAGVAFEYYDYAIFATFAPFFASQFFVGGDDVAQTLDTLLVFAFGFVSRPIGAMLSGRLSDRFGRKPLMLTGLAMTAL